MKRIAVLLAFAFAVTAFAQRGPQPRHNNARSNNVWTYGPNSRWNPSWDQRPDPRSGACFYTTAPYRGHRFCVRSGDRLPALPGNFGDNISSVQLFGNASVRVFNDRNFRNGSVLLRRSVTDLRRVPFRGGHTWNNRVSSIIVY